MESYSAKIYSREDFKRKDGTNPLYLRITINRKTKKFTLGISVKSSYWDKKNGKVRKGDPAHFNKNLTLESCLKRAEEILFEYRINRKQLTFDAFDVAYQVQHSQKTLSFIDYATEYVESMYRNNGSYDTYRTRKSCISKVKQFAKGDISLTSIDLAFLQRFEEHMNIVDGNSQSSRARIFAFMKAVINKAINEELIADNIFRKFKFSAQDGTREYLTNDEVLKLKAIHYSPNTHKTIKTALVPFLFACYTGIRFRDISELHFKHIIHVSENGTSKSYLQFVMHKTKEAIQIPLSNMALELIPNKTFDEDKLFKVYTNQPLNRYLKEAMDLAGITKTITFHCARHTFATQLLDAGVHLETVRKLLGHNDSKTTQIYAKTSLKSKESAIDALNKCFEEVDSNTSA